MALCIQPDQMAEYCDNQVIKFTCHAAGVRPRQPGPDQSVEAKKALPQYIQAKNRCKSNRSHGSDTVGMQQAKLLQHLEPKGKSTTLA